MYAYVADDACGTSSACRYSVCHAHRASCPVSGAYRVGVYGRLDNQLEATPISLYWLTIVLMNTCLLVVTVYLVVAVGWVRPRRDGIK